MKRRAAVAAVVAASGMVLSDSGGAQSWGGRTLHRPIPGDLPIETEPHAVSPPATPDALREAAGVSTGWSEPQPIDEQAVRPLDSSEIPARQLDRETRSPPGTELRYREVFTPAVAPFKRGQAYDALDELGRLTVRDPALRPLPVGEPTSWRGARVARFVGELLVQLSPTRPTPVPSVGAEQRVVSYATSSGQPVAFARDSAGNLFVRGTREGTVRLTYVLEAPESAFQPPFVPAVSVLQAAAEVPAHERPQVPAWLRTSAAAVLAHVRVARTDPLNVALARLIGHFRAFRDADLPETRAADLYTELALGGVGACRHRAYALVPTLHALGLPARYVGNEAHAWVELFVPRLGWTRVDLGGWDVPLHATAPSDRPAFRPGNADPFPQPANYTSGYSYASAAHGSGVGGGDPGAGVPQGGATGPGGEPSSASAGVMSPGAQHAGAVGAAGDPAASGVARATGGAAPSASASWSGGGAPGDPSGADGQAVTRTTLTVRPIRPDVTGSFAAGDGFVRGSMVLIEGELHDERGQGVGGLAVEVHLLRGRRIVQTLGTTVSRPDGRWEAHVLLPPALAPGEYNVRATTPGDARHSSASGD